MWGNRIGWVIAAVVLLFEAAFLYTSVWIQGRATPANAEGRRLATLRTEMPLPPQRVADWMNGDADGTDLYQRAIDSFVAERGAEKFNDWWRSWSQTAGRNLKDPSKWPAPPKLAAIDLVLQAATTQDARVFASRMEQVVTPMLTRDFVEQVKALGEACEKIGLSLTARSRSLKTAGKTAEAQNAMREAIRHYQAGFSLGARMYAERLVLPELDAAMDLLRDNATGLAEAYKELGDEAAEKKFREFEAARDAFYKENILPVMKAINTVDPQAGNVRLLARESPERVWRVEAALALGRVKFSGKFGDQSEARRMLRTLQADGDPWVAHAAKVAYEMKIEEFRVIQ